MGEFYQNNKCMVVLFCVLTGLVALTSIIVMPMCFSYVEYWEYGFVRQRSTGKVNTGVIYSGGKYFLGPDYEFKTFKASAHFLDLENIAIFTADKLEYFLREDELPLLHDRYDIHYKEVVSSSAIDALKGAIPVFSPRELTGNRSQVEEAIFKAVSQRLGGKCCRPDCDEEYKYACFEGCKQRDECLDSDKGMNVNVKSLQMTGVKIPEIVEDRYMEALTLKEKAAREELMQTASIIRRETTALVNAVKNNATEINQEAIATADGERKIANADYQSYIEGARAIGLRNLYERLNITDQEHKNSFDYLRTLVRFNKARLAVDFDQKIVGNL
ncbi:hypothetical protein MAR_006522 [Mya arenaria]|uniref:Band 7 domain-containing protein n=1 Tax=Mya arenaria TaxID=6604 RepID=A0ABY7D8Q0_MYAAR|nr:hypothetical protein MAR_006522 [Mya arenaria]